MQKPKGKQGTKGQKQIYEENQSTLKMYFYALVVVHVSNKFLCFRTQILVFTSLLHLTFSFRFIKGLELTLLALQAYDLFV